MERLPTADPAVSYKIDISLGLDLPLRHVLQVSLLQTVLAGRTGRSDFDLAEGNAFRARRFCR